MALEWVEVEGKTVEEATRAGLSDLGISDREQATIEVLQEPKSGFLGIGAQAALVKITPKPVEQEQKSRRRRRRRKSGTGSSPSPDGSPSQDSGRSQQQSSSDSSKSSPKPKRSDAKSSSGRSGRSSGRQSEKSSKAGTSRGRKEQHEGRKMKAESNDRPEVSIEERADVAATFVRGLLEAFGLEGDVTTKIEDDIVKIDVVGDQTEALVGPKGTVMQAVLEITRTVVQRKTYGAPRIRLDIAGYGERRREALTIYAGKLAEKVLAEGGEVMLEPMNAADRKVIHDSVADIEGVRSFSEGEDPTRAVVLAPSD